jgi:ABC-type amino acid transport substrate-binding protein
MKKTKFLLTIFVLLSLMVVGCAGQETAEDDVLKVGLEGTYRPFNYETKEGELTGYDVEVAREIADRLGYQVEFVPTEWSGMFGALEAKKFDMIVNQVAITPKRKEKYAFTVPYVHSGAQLIVREEADDISSLADLKGKKVGVGLGSNYEQIVNEFDGDNEIEVKTYQVLLDTLNDVGAGRIDAALNDKLVAGINIKKSDLDLKLAGEPVKEVVNGIALRKDSQELLTEVNGALKEMKQDGTLSEISMKWFGVDVSN